MCTPDAPFIVGHAIQRMSEQEREDVVRRMKEQCSKMTPEQKQKMMDTMPEVLKNMMAGDETEAGMVGMMSEMKECCQGMEMPMTPQIMTEMMPQCLRIMLPNMPKEKRIDFALKMVTALVEQGCVGMSNEEKEDFVTKVVEEVKT